MIFFSQTLHLFRFQLHIRLAVCILAIACLTSVPPAFSKKLIVDSPISEMQFADRLDIEEVIVEEGSGNMAIPDYAFLGCANLRKVSLSADVKKIGFQAFSECSSLQSIELPSALQDIGSNAFAYCSELQDISFPPTLKHIGHNAFSFCLALTEIFLPDSLEELESYAFSDCISLTKAKLPANGNLLGELIFNCCPRLTVLIEPSLEVPPYDCDSYPFDPSDSHAYSQCMLLVEKNMVSKYSVANPWHLFNKIATISDKPCMR